MAPVDVPRIKALSGKTTERHKISPIGLFIQIKYLFILHLLNSRRRRNNFIDTRSCASA